jgi:hypothetical protein
VFITTCLTPTYISLDSIRRIIIIRRRIIIIIIIIIRRRIIIRPFFIFKSRRNQRH